MENLMLKVNPVKKKILINSEARWQLLGILSDLLNRI